MCLCNQKAFLLTNPEFPNPPRNTFINSAGNPNIQFCLATIDENGNPTGDENVWDEGYYLFLTNSSDIQVGIDLLEQNNGILSFTYNEEIFTFDLSNSFSQDYGKYFFEIYIYDDDGTDDIYCKRIILNEEASYFIYFVRNGFGGSFSISSPNQLIDYR